MAGSVSCVRISTLASVSDLSLQEQKHTATQTSFPLVKGRYHSKTVQLFPLCFVRYFCVLTKFIHGRYMLIFKFDILKLVQPSYNKTLKILKFY